MTGGVTFRPPGASDEENTYALDAQGRLAPTAQRLLNVTKPRRLRAHWRVTVNGQNVTDRFDPFLISATVLDKEQEADVAVIELDDRYGRIVLPDDGARVQIAFGWSDEGMRTTFEGTVSDLESYAQKSTGRLLRIEAKSVNLLSWVKGQFSGNWGDGEKEELKLGGVLEDVAKKLGLSAKIDPDIAAKTRKYWTMANESPMQFFMRMAREHGAVAKFQGDTVSITKSDDFVNAEGEQMQKILAVAGQNLMAWRIRPVSSRAQWAKTAHMYFDRMKADMKIHGKEVGGSGPFGKAAAEHLGWMPKGTEGVAQEQAGSDATTSLRRRGYGWVVIDGEPRAQSQAPIGIVGARPGVDGDYRIVEVEHNYLRGGGYTTRCDVEQPKAALPDTPGEFPQG